MENDIFNQLREFEGIAAEISLFRNGNIRKYTLSLIKKGEKEPNNFQKAMVGPCYLNEETGEYFDNEYSSSDNNDRIDNFKQLDLDDSVIIRDNPFKVLVWVVAKLKKTIKKY